MTDSTLDPKVVKKALRQRSSLWPAALIALCVTVLASVAIVSLYAWGAAKGTQVHRLRAETICRSDVSATFDDALARYESDLGSSQLATSNALIALGLKDDAGFVADIKILEDTNTRLTVTLPAFQSVAASLQTQISACSTGGK
jgi:hypothetical protein